MNKWMRTVHVLGMAAFICVVTTACTPPVNTAIPDPCDGGGGGGRALAAQAPLSPPMSQEELRTRRDRFAERVGDGAVP